MLYCYAQVDISILLSEIDTYETKNDCIHVVPSILDGALYC